MAAIVSRIGQQGIIQSRQSGQSGASGQSGRPSTRKNRVARVSAKAAQRSSARRGEVEAESDPEIDIDAVAGEPEGEGETEAETETASLARRPDNATYLSMYFRDMAALDVLRPEEEFTSAREIETLEIMLWEAVLAHAPAVEHVFAAIEPLSPLPGEAKTLRAGAKRGAAPKAWTKLAARAARKLRADDVDHLFIDAALGAIDRITLGIGARGNTVGAPRCPA